MLQYAKHKEFILKKGTKTQTWNSIMEEMKKNKNPTKTFLIIMEERGDKTNNFQIWKKEQNKR